MTENQTETRKLFALNTLNLEITDSLTDYFDGEVGCYKFTVIQKIHFENKTLSIELVEVEQILGCQMFFEDPLFLGLDVCGDGVYVDCSDMILEMVAQCENEREVIRVIEAWKVALEGIHLKLGGIQQFIWDGIACWEKVRDVFGVDEFPVYYDALYGDVSISVDDFSVECFDVLESMRDVINRSHVMLDMSPFEKYVLEYTEAISPPRIDSDSQKKLWNRLEDEFPNINLVEELLRINSAESLFFLGRVYQHGLKSRNIMSNIDLALKYYNESVNRDCPYPLLNIGNIHEDAFNDIKKAEEYFLKAYECGYTSGLYNMACMYGHSQPDIAIEYYKRTIEEEPTHASALYNLGITYSRKRDYENEKKYYLLAVEQGHISAMYNLGFYFHRIEKNIPLAKQYYTMAFKHGHARALEKLIKLEKSKK
eukprot:TRINITY_DN13040_c0_g1_i1.p1 TRINITY_DN13040_c0_g1~~TRINITY_DN13040_c0_g1_i1.p1  ORF type:complete len:425 (-),score=51.38 TRINITY_DN13040_c0_g1_i1:60-1334(-)